MALQPGTHAPDFELFNTEKKQVKLSSLRGKKVIIHFFPQAFTGVCTTQLCTMRDNLNYYDVYLGNFAFGMIGVAKRSAFVINEEGVIIHSEETPTPGDLPDFEAIKKAVNS